MKNLTKSSLKEFNIEEARGWTIERLQQIEYRINDIIIDYFKPDNKHKFTKILLNSSILDIGSKLKVLKNIGTIEKSTIEKIRLLSSIRNGFAHAPIIQHITIKLDVKKDNTINSSSSVTKSMIEVMNAQGEIKTKNAYDYLVEFWTLDNEIREKI